MGSLGQLIAQAVPAAALFFFALGGGGGTRTGRHHHAHHYVICVLLTVCFTPGGAAGQVYMPVLPGLKLMLKNGRFCGWFWRS